MKNIRLVKLLMVMMIVGVALLVAVACSSTAATTLTTTTATTSAIITTTTSTLATTTTTSTPATVPTTALGYTVKTAFKADLGNYLVDARGMTLYYFTKDSVGKSTATGNVLAAWPIFNPTVFVLASSLNAADFGTITRDDGQKQATFKGWPLYYYAKDLASGDTLGQGVNNVWFVIDPAKFPPQPASTTTTSPPPTSSVTLTPTPSSTTSSAAGASVTIDLIAQNMAFNMSKMTVAAGASVTINFNNKDGGIPHNFSLYTDSSAAPPPIFLGQTITGPATITYKFTAPATPGTYFFRCDVHPTSMTGSFVVQ
jgi:predicted lipoprotein with Yx(FWY)xxD motif/plastocyanin